MVERTDHFAKMRAEQEPAPSEPPEGAPFIAPYLIEWLEEHFPSPAPNTATSLDGAIMLITRQAQRSGELAVIGYLKTLVKGA